MRYRARGDFMVGSRISWEGRVDELQQHLDRVVDSLREEDAIGAIDIDADLEKTSVTLDMVVDIPKDNPEYDHEVRLMVSQAILEAGGMVTNLLPLRVESQQKPNRPSWWGLRTPKWTAHGFTVIPEEGGGREQ